MDKIVSISDTCHEKKDLFAVQNVGNFWVFILSWNLFYLIHCDKEYVSVSINICPWQDPKVLHSGKVAKNKAIWLQHGIKITRESWHIPKITFQVDILESILYIYNYHDTTHNPLKNSICAYNLIMNPEHVYFLVKWHCGKLVLCFLFVFISKSRIFVVLTSGSNKLLSNCHPITLYTA